jgi:hypothetical protein
MPVELTNLLQVLLMLALTVGVLRIVHAFRAKAMRNLAARLGFHYVGPTAPMWWNPFHPKINPPLPGWLARDFRPGQIRQVWNVVEGQLNGVSILIFDAVIGSKGGTPCTSIACRTKQNPFGVVTSPDRLFQSHGYTILSGVWFLWFSWTMRVQRVERHVKNLRVDSIPVVDSV